MKFEIRATHSGAIPFTATVYVIAISGQQVNFLNHPDAGVSEDDAGPEAHRYPEQHVLARKRNLHFFHRRSVDDELWRLDASVAKTAFSAAPRGSGIGSSNGRLQPVGFVTEDLAGTIVQVGFIEK
jgi:hypothetical protein